MSSRDLGESEKNEDASAGKSRSDKVKLELLNGYQFKITFPDRDNTTLVMDEPPPLGGLKGPNAARVLAASIANCLSASLLFCLNKSRIQVKNLKAEAEPVVSRNKDGYWRVTRVNVSLHPELQENSSDVEKTRIRRCLDLFENYCVVTGAVRNGMTVDVKVDTPEIK